MDDPDDAARIAAATATATDTDASTSVGSTVGSDDGSQSASASGWMAEEGARFGMLCESARCVLDQR
jgi:hypothetical protein